MPDSVFTVDIITTRLAAGAGGIDFDPLTTICGNLLSTVSQARHICHPHAPSTHTQAHTSTRTYAHLRAQTYTNRVVFCDV